MPKDTFDSKSRLVQVMAWWRQAASQYLSQCWPRSMPRWVNCLFSCTQQRKHHSCTLISLYALNLAIVFVRQHCNWLLWVCLKMWVSDSQTFARWGFSFFGSPGNLRPWVVWEKGTWSSVNSCTRQQFSHECDSFCDITRPLIYLRGLLWDPWPLEAAKMTQSVMFV